MIHLVAERLWDWSADLDRIADLDGHFELRAGRGDEVRTDQRRTTRLPVPEANDAAHHRDRPRVPSQSSPYDRSRIHLDQTGDQDRLTRFPLEAGTKRTLAYTARSKFSNAFIACGS